MRELEPLGSDKNLIPSPQNRILVPLSFFFFKISKSTAIGSISAALSFGGVVRAPFPNSG